MFTPLFPLFLRHAHYQTGNTPLALVWKDNYCSEYFLDTDSKGLVPTQQQVESVASVDSYYDITLRSWHLFTEEKFPNVLWLHVRKKVKLFFYMIMLQLTSATF